MDAEGRVGVQSLTDGAGAVIRLGKTGSVMTALANSPYEYIVREGNVWSASNQAAQAVSVALATTYTGFCLSNPLGSVVDLILLQVSWAVTVAPAGIASLHLIGGFSATTNVTHTAPITTLTNNHFNQGTPIAKVDSQATIPTPVYLTHLSSGNTAAALPAAGTNIYYAEGQWVLPPGAFIAIGALTAATGLFSMTWEERSS